jgi:hypothetical protein
MEHSRVISLWPSDFEFAADAGVPLSLVRSWKFRNAIPGRYWLKIADAAQRRGIWSVTLRAIAMGGQIDDGLE